MIVGRARKPGTSRALLLVCAVAAACTTPPPAPEWIQGSSTSYPDDRFVVGVAADANADRAAEMAIRSIKEQTKGETEGARVVDTWKDPKTDSRWALAVLDREPLIGKLQAQLETIDSRIALALAKADSDAPHEALSDLAAAVSLMPARDRLRERVRNLGGNPTEDGAAPKLESRLAEVKQLLRVEVASFEMDPKTGEAGSPLDENRRALTQAVIAQGFTPGTADVAWGADPVWLRVESKVAVDRMRLHPDDTLVAVHWDAVVEITDVAAGGDVVAVITEEGRSVHLSEPEAWRQADAAARDFAAAALDGWLQARTGASAGHAQAGSGEARR